MVQNLGVLPLQLVCQLIATSSPTVNPNMTLILDSGTSAAQSQTSTLPEGYVKFSRFRTAYKIHDNELSWDEAREQCISEGGHLAIIDSSEKIAAVLGMKPLTESVYIGFHRYSDNQEEWLRVDTGIPVTSIPWATANPDGTGQCTSIAYDGAGIWDVSCQYTRKFVCEISL